jgi:uncharacterized protein YggE
MEIRGTGILFLFRKTVLKNITMLKLLIPFVALFGSAAANAQVKTTHEIVAEGGARVLVAPDVAVLTLTIEKTDTSEQNALSLLNAQVAHLSGLLDRLGFPAGSIHIAEYEVTSERDEESGRKWTTASNALKIEFGLEHKVLQSFYREVQSTGMDDLDIEFGTRLSDSLEKAVRRTLVQKAIEDARSNAVAISGALGVKLLAVKQVSKYAESGREISRIELVKFTPPRIVGDTGISYHTPFNRYTAEPIELEEKITIVYEISN